MDSNLFFIFVKNKKMEGRDIRRLIAIWFGLYLLIGYIVGEFNPFLFDPKVRFIQVGIFIYFVYLYLNKSGKI